MVAGMNTRLLPAASVMGVKDGAGSMKYRLTHKCPTPSGLAVQRMSLGACGLLERQKPLAVSTRPCSAFRWAFRQSPRRPSPS